MRVFFMLIAFLFLPVHFSQAQETSELAVADQFRSALLQEDTDKISSLIESGVGLNLVPPDGRPLILIAAVESSPTMLEFLVSNGANLNAKDTHGYSAVMKALEFGRVDNAKKLEALGASLEGISDDGYTVRLLAERVGLEDFGPVYQSDTLPHLTTDDVNGLLLYAAEAGDIEAVVFAIDQGAKYNTKAQNGWTPLMLAALGGHADVFSYLLENGFPQWAGFNTEVDGVDLVMAILVGEGGGNHKNVEAMLESLLTRRPKAFDGEGKPYRQIARRMELPSSIVEMFSETYKPLPHLTSAMPVGMAKGKEGWKAVQRVLQQQGYYKDRIDGAPGPQTYRALYAYHEPFIAKLWENCALAAERAYGSGYPQQDSDFAYGKALHPIGSSSATQHAHVSGEFNTRSQRPKITGYAVAKYKSYDICRLAKMGKYLGTHSVDGFMLWRRSKDTSRHTKLSSRLFDGWVEFSISKKSVIIRYTSYNNGDRLSQELGTLPIGREMDPDSVIFKN